LVALVVVASKNVPTHPGLAGKVAATCRLLAANGAKVAVNGRDEAAIDAVVGEIRGDGAECTDFAAIERMCRRVEREFGPVDVLVAFAGGGDRRRGRSVRAKFGVLVLWKYDEGCAVSEKGSRQPRGESATAPMYRRGALEGRIRRVETSRSPQRPEGRYV
jgi:NAD(P)-dependent dehydrogenase (short-subunit alcohol dehydrogenase family)